MELIIEFLIQFIPFIFLNENGDKELTKKGKIVLILSSIVICISIIKPYVYFMELGLLFAIIGFALTGLVIFALLKILNNKKKLGISLSIIYVLISTILLYMSNNIIDLSQLIMYLIEFILIIVICVIDIESKEIK